MPRKMILTFHQNSAEGAIEIERACVRRKKPLKANLLKNKMERSVAMSFIKKCASVKPSALEQDMKQNAIASAFVASSPPSSNFGDDDDFLNEDSSETTATAFSPRSPISHS